MRCPFCLSPNTSVKDSRHSDDNNAVRRRRFCEDCGSRFTTFERVQLRSLTVVKKNQQKKPFDREKLTRSFELALRKRPITAEKIEEAVGKVIYNLEKLGEQEIETSQIGEQVMLTLKEIDAIAYVRFASVYKNFTETQDFEDFARSIVSK